MEFGTIENNNKIYKHINVETKLKIICDVNHEAPSSCFSETPCSPEGKLSDGKGGHIAFVLPERNRTKHVWHFRGQVKKKISTLLAVHFRAYVIDP